MSSEFFPADRYPEAHDTQAVWKRLWESYDDFSHGRTPRMLVASGFDGYGADWLYWAQRCLT